MEFHKSNLGSFGENVPSDMDGYVPTADTSPWELSYDHGSEYTHDEDGNLTEYGRWWKDERFPEIKADAIKATENAEDRIDERRES
jgi:hypothetical protein